MLKFGTGQGQAGVHERQPLILDREAELAAVTAAITAATGGRGTLIVVRGPAGIGKTTILRAALAEARERGIRTLTAQGKLQGIIIGLMPILVWVGFDFFRPDLTRPMLHHWFGAALIGTVAVMELFGALVIRHIVRIEL